MLHPDTKSWQDWQLGKCIYLAHNWSVSGEWLTLIRVISLDDNVDGCRKHRVSSIDCNAHPSTLCFSSEVPNGVEQTDGIFKLWQMAKFWNLLPVPPWTWELMIWEMFAPQACHSLHPIDWELNIQDGAVARRVCANDYSPLTLMVAIS